VRVFISWSGNTSREIAHSLREWLPNVLQVVEPWVSSEDIDKGARWSAEIGRQLDGSHFGILCVTPDNMAAPWLNFEAGALAKSFDTTRVSPFLVGLMPADLVGPISQFQATTATLSDATRLIRALNKSSESPIEDDRIVRATHLWWPIRDKRLEEIRGLPPAPTKSARDVRDMVDEVLQISRQIQRQMALDELALELEEGADELLVEQIHTILANAGHQVTDFGYGDRAIVLYTDQILPEEILNRIRSRAARIARQVYVRPREAEEYDEMRHGVHFPEDGPPAMGAVRDRPGFSWSVLARTVAHPSRAGALRRIWNRERAGRPHVP
jgi:TIR domain